MVNKVVANYLRTSEACKIAGTNRNTVLRWIRQGQFADVKLRDRNGWRLFSTSDIARLIREVNRVE